MTSDKAIAQMFRMGNIGGAKELSGIKASTAKPAGVNDFNTFYAAKAAEGMTKDEISQAWLARQKELQSSRIPGMVQGPSPDVAFDRRSGTYKRTDTGEKATATEVKEGAGNYAWYKAPGTQRLIRRTESIVAKDGAVDEAIRFATLVDNPAGTPLNKLTGKAKTMFGSSQRSLLDLVHGLSSEEIQQIMGAQGGGERFLEFTNALNDPNQSVEQYVNNAKELKYLIYTRQAANVRGTPEEKKWEEMGKQFKADRPFAPAQSGAKTWEELKKQKGY